MEDYNTKNSNSNLLVAILCSILFGFVGSVIYGVLYYLGYIAWIGAYALVMLVGFGYKKFYGKIDKKGYVIVSIISIIEALVTIFICLGITVSKAYDVSFGTAMGAVFKVLSDNSVLSAVIQDIIISLIFIVAGIVSYYFIDKRNSKLQAESVIAQDNADVTQINQIETSVLPENDINSNDVNQEVTQVEKEDDLENIKNDDSNK